MTRTSNEQQSGFNSLEISRQGCEYHVQTFNPSDESELVEFLKFLRMLIDQFHNFCILRVGDIKYTFERPSGIQRFREGLSFYYEAQSSSLVTIEDLEEAIRQDPTGEHIQSDQLSDLLGQVQTD